VKYAGELTIPLVRFPVGYWITVQNEITVIGLHSRVFPRPASAPVCVKQLPTKLGVLAGKTANGRGDQHSSLAVKVHPATEIIAFLIAGSPAEFRANSHLRYY
jgi:hypothetical protein